MKNLKNIFILAICIYAVNHSTAQTVDDIIAKHIENTGGKEKWNTITTLTMNFNMNVMGLDGASTGVLVVGKGLKTTMDFNGQKIIQVVTPQNGWMVNQLAGISQPQALPEEQHLQSKDQLDPLPFFDYALKGSKVELAGREKIETGDTYKIVLTNKENVKTTYYFDADTYNLVKTVKKMNVQGLVVDVTTLYSDFRKTDYGIVMPFISKIEYGEFQMTTTISSIEFNKSVDPAIFEMK